MARKAMTKTDTVAGIDKRISELKAKRSAIINKNRKARDKKLIHIGIAIEKNFGTHITEHDINELLNQNAEFKNMMAQLLPPAPAPEEAEEAKEESKEAEEVEKVEAEADGEKQEQEAEDFHDLPSDDEISTFPNADDLPNPF